MREGALDIDDEDLRERCIAEPLHQRTGRARGGRSADKVVPIGVRTAQRRKQITGHQLARVDLDLVKVAVRAVEPAMAGGSKLREAADDGGLHHARRPGARQSASAARTALASSNARRTRPTI